MGSMNEMESIKKFERCQELAQDLGFTIEVLSNCFEIESRGRFDNIDALHGFLCGFEQGRSYGRMESVLILPNKERMKKVSSLEEIWNHRVKNMKKRREA